jgi:hypothetical protein
LGFKVPEAADEAYVHIAPLSEHLELAARRPYKPIDWMRRSQAAKTRLESDLAVDIFERLI